MQGSPQHEVIAKALADQLQAVLDRFINTFFQSEASQGLIARWLRKEYQGQIDILKTQFGIDFTPDENTLRNLEESISDSIKGITEEMRARIGRELKVGLAANEDNSQLKRRIGKIFRGDNPTRFRFENRMEMIRRTETQRARNLAIHDVAQQLPFPVKKRVSVVLDARTSPICIAMNKKYGDDDQAIQIDKQFKVRAKVGKKTITISELTPPFHVNCRTQYVTVIADDEEDE